MFCQPFNFSLFAFRWNHNLDFKVQAGKMRQISLKRTVSCGWKHYKQVSWTLCDRILTGPILRVSDLLLPEWIKPRCDCWKQIGGQRSENHTLLRSQDCSGISSRSWWFTVLWLKTSGGWFQFNGDVSSDQGLEFRSETGFNNQSVT